MAAIILATGMSQHASAGESAADSAAYAEKRRRMVETQIVARGIVDLTVLDAMRTVPRHRFIPADQVSRAYGDHPLPIGCEQTISQPFIVAAMTEALEPKPGHRVLEIGTGSGYQAAVLAEIVRDVYTIEIVEPLGLRAESTLAVLAYRNVRVRIGDGYRGWPERAPFDGIIVTAAPDHIPQPLVDQLAVGGRMVLPVGSDTQNLMVLTKTPDSLITEERFGVRFVPMTGDAQHGPASSAQPGDSAGRRDEP
ncbi:MAG TPA: protein-L-isoaspartate(D-aspartate) O-methyltransferase [candidate division Zixibacteria bacterium]|jgi:protein-L-isoaspartate(D-aspartate) O-methyltransferase